MLWLLKGLLEAPCSQTGFVVSASRSDAHNFQYNNIPRVSIKYFFLINYFKVASIYITGKLTYVYICIGKEDYNFPFFQKIKKENEAYRISCLKFSDSRGTETLDLWTVLTLPHDYYKNFACGIQH